MILVFYFFLTAMFTASYSLTAYVYQVSGLRPSTWLVQIINSLLGLLLAGLLIGGVGKLANARGWMPERNVFASIIDALERIAQGDFSIQLGKFSPG